MDRYVKSFIYCAKTTKRGHYHAVKNTNRMPFIYDIHDWILLSEASYSGEVNEDISNTYESGASECIVWFHYGLYGKSQGYYFRWGQSNSAYYLFVVHTGLYLCAVSIYEKLSGGRFEI